MDNKKLENYKELLEAAKKALNLMVWEGLYVEGFEEAIDKAEDDLYG